MAGVTAETVIKMTAQGQEAVQRALDAVRKGIEGVGKAAEAGAKASRDFRIGLDAVESSARKVALVGAVLSGAMIALSVRQETLLRSQRALQFSLSTQSLEWSKYGDQVNEALTVMARATGQSLPDLQRTFAGMLPIVKDTGAAIDATRVALDLEAGTGGMVNGLDTVRRLLAGDEGVIYELQRLGFEVDHNKAPSENLAIIMDQVGGAAERAARPIDKMRQRVQELTDKAALLDQKSGGLVIALGVAGGAFLALAAAAAVAGITIATLGAPVLLIIGAVAALIAVGVVLYLNWDRVWTFVKAHTEKVVAVLTVVFGPLVAAIYLIVKAALWLRDNWQAVWTAVRTALSAAWNAVKVVFGFLTGDLALMRAGLNGLRAVWDTVFNALRTPVEAAWAAIKPIFDAIRNGWEFVMNIPGIGAAIGTLLKPLEILGGKVDGGPVTRSGSYVVGERGPEVVHMPGGAFVQPNGALGGGMTNITIVLDGEVLYRAIVPHAVRDVRLQGVA